MKTNNGFPIRESGHSYMLPVSAYFVRQYVLVALMMALILAVSWMER
ncbi:MAG: hypothetical protein K1X47_00060 [Cyclobacteriaceae bacterium]|nr:hypothetical protein [Cyclobacteriaceae bacterium]